MQVTEYNDIKVYNLSAGKSLPQWLAEAQKKKQSLRHNEDFKKRIDLIQDFEFNVASSRVRISPDGTHVLATGIYAPELRIFDLKELGLKCSRGLDSEVVDLLLLSEDWKKLVMLLDDRTLEFHSQYGRHHRLRVPKCGRSLSYDSESCNLFVGGSSSSLYRLDLEAGTFLTPVEMQKLTEINEVVTNPRLPILTCCGDGGIVESWDLRDQSPLQSLKVTDAGIGEAAQVTRCAYSSNGMFFAAGTSEGLVRVYDLRSSRPIAERDHMNDYAISSLCFHSRGPESSDLLVASADRNSIKVWAATSGRMVASMESPSVVNQIAFYPNSGMIFAANDQSMRMGVYFVPSIGLAPPWCSFLDNITEELEESKQKTVFEDFQFVTKDELEQLGATETLVGTKYLQPYMHGFFMDYRLHAKLKAALDPFAFEEYRKQKVREKLEAKRTMRTRLKDQSKVSVNPNFHKQLQETAEEGATAGASKKRKEAADKAKRILEDQRFQALFADPDFAIEDSANRAAEASATAAAALAARTKKKRTTTVRKG